ncbi:tripartite tricarboxylate transporter substrate binding protein [Variovorax sp. PBL-E5]|uniref:tripartite tricarboxylate transporter substrate binding protein n=1 Tax=Variovorax sp. PBL-E5 TaxID=434014 RepID=UPI001315B3F9|nr:tripartite tricarboxylate transporter substrate binding protein [Variovorax sp. PBL-E5]VTU29474.1 Argininosuccinate lyase [Variovorax sp. PBL-E5]
MKSPLRRSITLAALSAGALAALPIAHAQTDWPARPVTFLEPYGPGTTLDAITRVLAERLGTQWKVPVIVDHKPGANGVIGTDYVARAAADGYTVLFTGPGHYTNEVLMGKVPYDVGRDFKPVARLASVMLVLVVPTNSPFHSVKELVDHAKKNPGKLTYSSGGSGSSQHLAAASFQQVAGIELMHVPYKTQSAAVIDIISGEVNFGFAALTTAAAQLKGGKLRALAVTGPRRSQALPDLPTVAELGYPGWEYFSFNAVFVPTATPDEVVRRISDGLSAQMRSPAMADLARAQGFENDFADVRAWSAAQASERKKWQDLIRVSGAKLE